jgi:hypothetical protein
MSTSTTASFDVARFCRAVEQRDAEAQIEMYAPDCRVTIVDRITTPGSPRVLSTSREIRSWIEDTCSREMTHAVKQSVVDDRGAAFYEACRYPDGTNVMCATVLEISDGRVTNQTVVQAWDEG